MEYINYITAVMATVLAVQAGIKMYHFVGKLRTSPGMRGINSMPGKPEGWEKVFGDNDLDNQAGYIAAIKSATADVRALLDKRFAGVAEDDRRRLAVSGVLLNCVVRISGETTTIGETLGMGISTSSAMDVALHKLKAKAESLAEAHDGQPQEAKTMDTDVDQAMREAELAKQEGRMN